MKKLYKCESILEYPSEKYPAFEPENWYSNERLYLNKHEYLTEEYEWEDFVQSGCIPEATPEEYMLYKTYIKLIINLFNTYY